MKVQNDSMAILASAITGRHVPQAEARYQQHRQQSYYADPENHRSYYKL